jgi:hypothetical protein
VRRDIGFSSPLILVQATQAIGRSGFDAGALRTPAKTAATAAASPYPIIPWPFQPQNQAHRMWNNYEGLNSAENGYIAPDYPYLHQGLDMEVPANTPVYSVDTGIVKYHGDMGGSGALYWRIAVSRSRDTGAVNGWLYAHLVQNTINYDVGDRVPSVGLHLGDIVPWVGDIDGHLHFNEIRDHGAVWAFEDDQWGITYNPELSLRPNPDTTAPVFVTAIAGKSKFAYCPNQSGYGTRASAYFYPDSARGGLRGNVDIVARLYDYKIFTNHRQPAFALYYWIRGIDRSNSNYGRLIVDTTLGQIRNHAYNFYSAGNFKPASQVLYQVDSVFVVGGWFNRTRTFAHVLTNNNGDSVMNLGEADSSLRTARHWDGWYRLYVKALDVAGNAVVDSESVYFNNGNRDPNPVLSGGGTLPGFLQVGKIPGRAEISLVEIRYGLPQAGAASIVIMTPAGKQIRRLASGMHDQREHRILWDGKDDAGGKAPCGIYFLRLRSGSWSLARAFLR